MNALLFTTTRCPKCPAFKEFVAGSVSFPVDTLDETMAEFSEEIAKYGVANAPTIIIFGEDGEEAFRGTETYELEEFLKQHPSS
ncbi:thioredoxin family protein [Candidatus Gracilibacteria bacterium]|nr:thioredoxin family protein [Candidatus Gracilibacteria bacterium]